MVSKSVLTNLAALDSILLIFFGVMFAGVGVGGVFWYSMNKTLVIQYETMFLVGLGSTSLGALMVWALRKRAR
jgi:hypothetical protein